MTNQEILGFWARFKTAALERLIEKGIFSTTLGIIAILVSIALFIGGRDTLEWGAMASLGLILLGIKDSFLPLTK